LERCIGSSIVSEATPAQRQRYLAEALIFLSGGAEKLSLTGKSLGSADVADRFAEGVGRSEHIRWLQLDQNDFTDTTAAVLADALTEHPSLQSLDLDCNRIGDKGMVALSKVLQAQKSKLQELHLHLNSVGSAGATSLSIALVPNRTLRVLSLAGNKLIGPEGALAIGRAIQVNKALMSLSLHACYIGNPGAEHIASALTVNGDTVLQELSLGMNAISSKGAWELAKMLKLNKTVQELQLENNKIGDKGAGHLAEALTSNETIKDLWLVDNPITEMSLRYFAKALQRNTSLMRLGITANGGCDNPETKEAIASMRRSQIVRQAMQRLKDGCDVLDLRGTGIGDDGIERLAPVLQANCTTLRHLYLDKCGIHDAGAALLAEALGRADSEVEELSLYDNDIGPDGVNRLNLVLKNVAWKLSQLKLGRLPGTETPPPEELELEVPGEEGLQRPPEMVAPKLFFDPDEGFQPAAPPGMSRASHASSFHGDDFAAGPAGTSTSRRSDWGVAKTTMSRTSVHGSEFADDDDDGNFILGDMPAKTTMSRMSKASYASSMHGSEFADDEPSRTGFSRADEPARTSMSRMSKASYASSMHGSEFADDEPADTGYSRANGPARPTMSRLSRDSRRSVNSRVSFAPSMHGSEYADYDETGVDGPARTTMSRLSRDSRASHASSMHGSEFADDDFDEDEDVPEPQSKRTSSI